MGSLSAGVGRQCDAQAILHAARGLGSSFGKITLKKVRSTGGGGGSSKTAEQMAVPVPKIVDFQSPGRQIGRRDWTQPHASRIPTGSCQNMNDRMH